MNRSMWILCFAIAIQAVPAWGWDTVIVGDKEWYRVADMKGLCHEDFNTACPGGICTGSLAGNNLTGWTWASLDEVNELFNHYIGSDELNGPSEYDDDSTWGTKIVDDFGTNADGFIWLYPAAIGKTSTEFYIAYAQGYAGRNSRADTSKIWPDNLDETLCFLGAWLFRSVGAPAEAFTVHLEEPINMETHSGVGNLRGWAIAEDGIDRVEIYIDGKYVYDAPYGGSRPDVGDASPDIEGAENSGYSLAFGYSNLSDGEHTIKARAVDLNGDFVEDTSTFTVVGFDEPFIFSNETVDVGDSTISSEGDEISLEDVTVGEKVYDLKLKWRTAEQGFEIIEIR
jgi:hypothetical protein